MGKTLLAGEGKLKAALLIQRQWRFKKSGKKRVNFQEAVKILMRERKRELNSRYVPEWGAVIATKKNYIKLNGYGPRV